MFKQLIIARRDLNMSPGKLAAQVSHAKVKKLDGHIGISLNWIAEAETKVVCRAKNKNELEREGPEGTLIFSFEATDDG